MAAFGSGDPRGLGVITGCGEMDHSRGLIFKREDGMRQTYLGCVTIGKLHLPISNPFPRPVVGRARIR